MIKSKIFYVSMLVDKPANNTDVIRCFHDVFNIELGIKSNKFDAIQEIKKRGISGEILSIKEIKI